ncbi:MAG: HAD hydrolase family protein [Tissierellia bacterium]|nr:HAD hydrolase family protein [Tissierellia bacterium]
MGNAIEDVKKVADHICDNNENDGLAKWILENVLK